MAQEEFYKVRGKKRLEQLGWFSHIVKNLILAIQARWDTFAMPTKKSVRNLLRTKGAPSYVFRVTDKAYVGSHFFFEEVGHLLGQAKEIWMCVGEMGHRLMERDEIIHGLISAHKKYSATIKIIHGPRTDPNTERVFKLAFEKKVELFRLDYYPMHHFIFIVSNTGECTLIEESPHLEPVRALNDEGKTIEFYRSIHRIFYIIRNTGWLGQRRLKQAQHRIKRAEKYRFLNPDSEDNYRGYPLLSILLNIILVVFPYSFFVQPLLVLSDKLTGSGQVEVKSGGLAGYLHLILNQLNLDWREFFSFVKPLIAVFDKLKLSPRPLFLFVAVLIGMFILPSYTLVHSLALVIFGVLERVELVPDNIIYNLLQRDSNSGEEVSMKDKASSENIEDETFLLRKIENGTVIVIMSGVFAVLAGIALEVFLRVPLSNMTVYISGVSISTLAGGLIGSYINKYSG